VGTPNVQHARPEVTKDLHLYGIAKGAHSDFVPYDRAAQANSVAAEESSLNTTKRGDGNEISTEGLESARKPALVHESGCRGQHQSVAD